MGSQEYAGKENKMSRRSFLKYAAFAGAALLGGAGYLLTRKDDSTNYQTPSQKPSLESKPEQPYSSGQQGKDKGIIGGAEPVSSREQLFNYDYEKLIEVRDIDRMCPKGIRFNEFFDPKILSETGVRWCGDKQKGFIIYQSNVHDDISISRDFELLVGSSKNDYYLNIMKDIGNKNQEKLSVLEYMKK